jgi:hypothetical protein
MMILKFCKSVFSSYQHNEPGTDFLSRLGFGGNCNLFAIDLKQRNDIISPHYLKSEKPLFEIQPLPRAHRQGAQHRLPSRTNRPALHADIYIGRVPAQTIVRGNEFLKLQNANTAVF